MAIVFEAFALRTAVRHATPERCGRGWVDYVRTSRSPELPVLLLEDSGALIGLFFATAGVALAIITGNPLFDGLGTLAIGVLLVAIAIVLAIEMKSLLIGEAASPEVIRRIEGEVEQSPGVHRVINVLPRARPPRARVDGRLPSVLTSGTVPIVETGPLCARRGCRRPDWRDGLCHACWRLAVLFKKDPRMFAYKPLDDYGDERDAVELPWEKWEREAGARGLNLPDVIAQAGGDEVPPQEPRPAA